MSFRAVLFSLLRRKSFYGMILGYSILALIAAPMVESDSLVLTIVAFVTGVTFVPYLMKVISENEAPEKNCGEGDEANGQ
ncbi:hypothetical protein [Streptomyces xantholiticus]|uniref:hypothetical protein n=1 Tax=Streptomyces xantholiticus TaxID=68285 RepID=UPI0016760486|nr:hypothetical protein [Streptomyces xantholiticus]GGW69899.1 hypothetical protein GCM10010381_63390 [Streptomyces xantholiticus]